MIKVGLIGRSGRMGGLIAEVISKQEEMILSSFYTRRQNRSDDVAYQGEDWKSFLNLCDVVIDFSNHQLTQHLLLAIKDHPKPLVIGTTGLDQQTFEELKHISNIVPIVYATNTSRGIVLLNQIASFVSRALKDADIEIVETHHRYKKDSPSGTAMTLAEHCAKARGLDLNNVFLFGRHGNIQERGKNQIGVMSLRGGDIVGKHTIGFYCDGEYLELTHHATSRETFAIGAVQAARWVMLQKNGLYGMHDVLEQESFKI